MMSLSVGIRIMHSVGRRHVCNWTAHCTSFPPRTASISSVGQPLNVKVKDILSSACCSSHRHLRPMSSDSQDTFQDEKHSWKNDPEVKAWMSQISQDFETAPFQDLVKNQHPTEINNYQHIVDSASTDHNALESLDIEVEDFGYIEDGEDDMSAPAPERNIPVSLERGQHGVFDVEEVVSVLDEENGVDIKVIDVPPEARFVDHMVLVSGKSLRHMRAMAESIQWLYKRKKNRRDRDFKLEGRDCRDWMAIDLGNIVVHIFRPEARQHYDLETLWTLGPEHDDQRHYVQDDVLNLSPADLFWLESGGAASTSEEASPQQTGETLPSDGDVTHTMDQSLKAKVENDQKQVVSSLQTDLQKEKGFQKSDQSEC